MRPEAPWEAVRSIELKLICTPEVAEAMAGYVMATYAPNDSRNLFFTDVAVLRPEKY